MLPELLKGLGLTVPGSLWKRAQEVMRMGEARLLYVPGRQVATEVALLALGIAGAGIAGALAWRARRGQARRAGGRAGSGLLGRWASSA